MPSRQRVLDELVAERYRAVYRDPARAAAEASVSTDSPDVIAERQRVLNAALGGEHLVVVGRQEVAA